jgi:hypothetical protein
MHLGSSVDFTLKILVALSQDSSLRFNNRFFLLNIHRFLEMTELRLKERDNLENLGITGMSVLRQILKKQCMRPCIGFICLRMGPNCRFS